jgi:PhnB protein
MHISTYLNFNGECARAIKFYEQAIGAKVLFKMTWGESPMAKDCPVETHGLIMHSTLTVGDGQIMCADSPPDHYKKPTGMNVSLHVKDKAEGERLFKALSEGGNVQMPFEQTFWSPGFGMCVDRFGIPWMINTEGEIQG